MHSIRGRLIVGVVPGLVLLTLALGVVLYIYVRQELAEKLDISVMNRARVVISRSRWTDDHPPRLEAYDATNGEFARASRPSCFEIWEANGKPLVRSVSLDGKDLPFPDAKSNRPVMTDIQMPNGRVGRAVYFSFDFKSGPDDTDDPGTGSASAGKKMVLLLAKDRAPVDDPARVLLLSVLGMVVLMSGGTIFLMSLALHRGLRPLEKLARKAASESPDDDSALFPTLGMPRELLPICDKLNYLLQRYCDALRRQRGFTANAAHELRTPIAEIRAAADVALMCADPESARASLADILLVSKRMEAIVAALLAQARCETGQQTLSMQRLSLAPLIDRLWQRVSEQAGQRRLQFQMRVPADILIDSDPTLLEAIIFNLLSNAAEYAQSGTAVTCSARHDQGALVLEIANDVATLTPDDLRHFFQPFWRKDPSSGDDRHCGLGLSLTKAYADALNAAITAELRTERLLIVRLCLHASPTRDNDQPASGSPTLLPPDEHETRDSCPRKIRDC
ncbi:MAG: HAMP domain-containing sensor histidine kinase [Tepidisphaeraceae bacterium]|jgi:two-component system sensor histidine kinase QseC